MQINGGASGATFPNADTSITNQYGSGSGGGAAATVPFVPTTQSLAASCLPQLQIAKRTTTPLITFPASNTALYVITVSNSGGGGGAAGGVTVQDTLQAPFYYTPTVAPLNAIDIAYLGGATGPVSPTVGSGTRTVTIGTPGSNLLTNSFLLPDNGTVSFTLTAVINGQGVSPTLGSTYQNSATVSYLDPLRTAAGVQVSPGATYTVGGTVPGSNYASGSTTNEDVKVTGGTTTLTVTKSNGGAALIAGQTTNYTITVANLGGSAAPGTLLTDPVVSGLNCTAVTCAVTSGTASCPVPLNIGLLQGTGLAISPTFDAGSTVTFVVTCGVTANGQ